MNDDQYDEYVVHGATSLLETRQDTACDGSEGSSVVFASSGAGFECDNPTDAQNLGLVTCAECDQCVEQGFDEYFPIDQSSRAVMYAISVPDAPRLQICMLSGSPSNENEALFR